MKSFGNLNSFLLENCLNDLKWIKGQLLIFHVYNYFLQVILFGKTFEFNQRLEYFKEFIKLMVIQAKMNMAKELLMSE